MLFKQKIIKTGHIFTVRRMLARYSCRNSVCLSACLSVHPSVRHTRALRQNQTTHCGYFYTTRKGNHSSFLIPTVVGGRRPFHVKFALKLTHPIRKTPILRDCSAHISAVYLLPFDTVWLVLVYRAQRLPTKKDAEFREGW